MILRRSFRRFLNSKLVRGIRESELVWRIFRRLPRKVKRKIKEILHRIFETSTIPSMSISVEPWESGRPLLSVIVPCHNYGQFIRDALRSIQSQTYQDSEVIVVDDESTEPGTLQVLDQLEEEGYKILRLEGLGPSETPNRGISIAKGKYICRLDADDTLEPTYFEKCLCLLESNPGVTFAYTHLRAFGDEHWVRFAEPFNLRLLMDYNHINATAIFRRSAWDAVSGYDPLMEGYEDWEFWIRLGKAGFRGKLIPEILFNYRRHGRSLIDKAQKRHGKLMARMRTNHADLYSHPERAEEISQSYRDYTVSNPFLNLSSKSQYSKVSGGSVGLIITSSLQPQSSTEAMLYDTLPRLEGFDFLFVTTEEHDQLNESPPGLPGYQYDLPAFLDPYCWLQFVTNLIETRSIQFVIISNSRLGYEWSREIKTKIQMPIVDVLHDLRSDYVDLAKSYDRFIDFHIVFSEEVKESFGASEDKVRDISNLPVRENVANFRSILQDALTANPQRRNAIN